MAFGFGGNLLKHSQNYKPSGNPVMHCTSGQTRKTTDYFKLAWLGSEYQLLKAAGRENTF